MLTPRLKDPTQPLEPCIDVALGCEWIRVDRGSTVDFNTTESLILSAMAKIETHCKQPIFSREYYGYGDGFCGELILHSLNVTAVSKVEYQIKGNHAWTELNEAAYYWKVTGEVVFFDTPRIPDVTGIRVTYTAGYAYEAVPADIHQAVRLLIGRWFDNRADERKDVPTQVDWIIGSYILPVL
ncbi:head-tail connector protein [Spirosoma sp. KNUC1025]|uniref:head-tail connector protein n=1 Tax=Spirosoma sp. KNUC1025 TaxID=2894082 RepID=UPI0038650F1E|nr:phage gp6-like head-tail connector protein [Spirosoma sp. KNUC1025]